MKMRRKLVCCGLCAMLAILAAGCSGGGGGSSAGPPVDSTPPAVVATSPANGSVGVSVKSALTATFSEAMEATTISSATFTAKDAGDNPLSGTVSYSANVATFTPLSDLPPLSSITATVSTGARDLAGNALAAAHSWTFATAAATDTTPPAVISVSPASGAVGVPVDTVLSAVFSEAIDPATVSLASFLVKDGADNPVAGSVGYSGVTATFTPTASLALSTTYSATLTTALQDAIGNHLATSVVWSFTTGNTLGATTPVSFALGGAYPAEGFEPVLVDLNGDGQLDMALPAYSGYASVWLGTGSGAFGPRTDYPTGETSRGLVAADFNGDGKVDLAAVREFSSGGAAGAVSVVFGDGAGAFGAATHYLVESWPLDIVAGDFTGDGIPDLAVANRFSNSVSLLVGSATGSFAAPVHFAVGLQPLSIASGDFNEDGKLDLAVSGSGTVSVLLGDGSGAFSAPNSFAVGSYAWSATAHDLDGDGHLDLAVANEAEYVTVLMGTGTGSFNPGAQLPTAKYPRGLQAADLNHDGVLDLVVATMMNGGIGNNSVYVIRGKGGRQFEPPAIVYTVGGSGVLLPEVGRGDVNGDGKADLAVHDSAQGKVQILLNTTP